VVSGQVKSRSATTAINSFLGFGPFGSIRLNLSIPPFEPTNPVYTGSNPVNPPAVDTLLAAPRKLRAAAVTVPHGPRASFRHRCSRVSCESRHSRNPASASTPGFCA
jgi:hypothetical protein